MAEIEVEKIGPERAKELLAINRNRHVRASHVASLARDMSAGRWGSHSVIRIAQTPDGDVLIDGQHRLLAVIKSGETVQFVVMSGLQLDDQIDIDTGIRRSLADTLQLNGESSVTVIAAAIGHLWRRKRRMYTSNAAPTRSEGLRLLADNPALRESITPTSKASLLLKYPHGLGTCLHYEMCGIDSESAWDFWEKLTTGLGLHERHGIYLLRGRLQENAAASYRKLDVSHIHALTIKAWNTYMRGTETGVLKWTRGGATAEAFPELGDGQ